MNVKTQSWSEIRSRYDEFIRSGWKLSAMLVLLDWIEREALCSELYPITSMSSLVISNKENFRRGENTLAIEAIPSMNKVHFRYSRLVYSTDDMEKTVDESEAIETLRLFLAYKFGIHRSPAKDESVSTNT